MTEIDETAYDRLLKQADFEKCFLGPLAGRKAYRPKGRLFTRSGSWGIVLRLDRVAGQLTSDSIAVKIYKNRPFHDVCRRYQAIQTHLESLSVAPDLLLPPQLHENGLDVFGILAPVVVMPWVDGSQLGQYIENSYHENNRADTRVIAAEFILGMIQLERLGISVGDICPANVMVDRGGRLKLVDYDNMFVSALRGQLRFSEQSVVYKDKALAPVSFDEDSDKGATLRLFGELFSLSKDRRTRFGDPDWLLNIKDTVLQGELREQAETRELIDLYQKTVELLEKSPGTALPKPSEILVLCQRVRQNIKRFIEVSNDDVLRARWSDYLHPPTIALSRPNAAPRPSPPSVLPPSVLPPSVLPPSVLPPPVLPPPVLPPPVLPPPVLPPPVPPPPKRRRDPTEPPPTAESAQIFELQQRVKALERELAVLGSRLAEKELQIRSREEALEISRSVQEMATRPGLELIVAGAVGGMLLITLLWLAHLFL